jgi:hypothetical protein
MCICKRCNVDKPLDEFQMDKRRNKHYGTCRKCRVKAQNDRRLANIDESRKKTREYLREWRAKNPEKQAAINKKYDEKNRDKRSAYAKQYRKDNPEKVKALFESWAKANPEKIKGYMKKASKAWHERNPDYQSNFYKAHKERYVAARARRRAAQESATPSWLTAIDKAMIQEMYDVSEARYIQTGIKHHVDHIVPINGKGVAGMHVPWNLQVITAHENLSKGWRF